MVLPPALGLRARDCVCRSLPQHSKSTHNQNPFRSEFLRFFLRHANAPLLCELCEASAISAVKSSSVVIAPTNCTPPAKITSIKPHGPQEPTPSSPLL